MEDEGVAADSIPDVCLPGLVWEGAALPAEEELHWGAGRTSMCLKVEMEKVKQTEHCPSSQGSELALSITSAPPECPLKPRLHLGHPWRSPLLQGWSIPTALSLCWGYWCRDQLSAAHIGRLGGFIAHIAGEIWRVAGCTWTISVAGALCDPSE